MPSERVRGKFLAVDESGPLEAKASYSIVQVQLLNYHGRRFSQFLGRFAGHGVSSMARFRAVVLDSGFRQM
jgi:hypothetical protein